jgi:hypothetical protein
MTEKNYVEQWVCLATLSDAKKQCERLQRGDVVDIELFRQLADSINYPMPVSMSAQTFDVLPQMSGVELIRVELRFDNGEPYIAGLVRSKSITVSFLITRTDPLTGAPLPRKIIECYMFNDPTKPTADQTAPLAHTHQGRR